MTAVTENPSAIDSAVPSAIHPAGLPEDAEARLGYDLPALPGMAEAEIQTPCLIVDMDAFEANLDEMAGFCERAGVALRAHAKMHKCPDVARAQIARGAVGICCQKVAEAEVFARAGIRDILVSNQVRDPLKLDRLARLPLLGARVAVCVDDAAAVADLAAAAGRHGTEIGVLAEIDCGQGRCGVQPGAAAVPIARAALDAPCLRWEGLQAYHGSAQHFRSPAERQAAIDATLAHVRATKAALAEAGIDCPKVTGGGTGTYTLEGSSGVYQELQCGSYAFMDADYARNDQAGPFRHALFLLTSVMSHAKPDIAICDAGLKSQSVDSGLPVVWGEDGVSYSKCSDEHGIIADPEGRLAINQRLRLIPGHCDPTCNLHDWLVCVRAGRVEALWPVAARGLGL